MAKDWKQKLGEDEKRINEMLHNIEKYRNAYRKSDDVKASQFWAAVVEHNKKNKELMNRLELIEAAARRKEKPVIIEKIVREKPKRSYWQLPVGALPMLLATLILANITLAESASEASFAGSLALAFAMIVFTGVLWYSAFKD